MTTDDPRDVATWGLINADDDEADTPEQKLAALAPWIQQLTEIMTTIEPTEADPALVGGRSAAPIRDEIHDAIADALSEHVWAHGTGEIDGDGINDAADAVMALLSRSAAGPPEADGPVLPLALTEADARNLGRTTTVCEGCRKGHYSLGGKVTNYPCTTEGCGCWFCNTPIVTPAQAHAAGGVAAEPNEEAGDG